MAALSITPLRRPALPAVAVEPIGGLRGRRRPGCPLEADGSAESLRSWAVVYDGRSVATLRADLQLTRSQQAVAERNNEILPARRRRRRRGADPVAHGFMGA
jgi:hypothetical protein